MAVENGWERIDILHALHITRETGRVDGWVQRVERRVRDE